MKIKNFINMNSAKKTTVLALAVITVALVLLWAVPASQAADATNVTYIDAAGNPQTVPTATALDGSETTLTSGWYLAEGTLSYSNVLTISGNVSLILADSCNVTITGGSGNAGINVQQGNSLTIYAQSGGTGALSATGGDSGAGIGGYDGGGASTRNAGTITINGGIVNAVGGEDGAGIGGGSGGSGGTITINGGTVTAEGNSGFVGGGAGIGGGNGGDGGTITINSGDVTAIGSSLAAGIGGGGDIGNITINGGTVNATGGDSGAGIGGGFLCSGGNIVISGGDVTATGGNYGAGIGGGLMGEGGNITIAGGTVTAYGGDGSTIYGGGAGIGSGASSLDAGTIIIAASANVTAQGGTALTMGDGADIGYGGAAAEGQAVTPGTTVTYHTVTITPPSNGVITALPGGATDSVQVPDGANQTFIFTPDSGHEIISISVDGSSVGAVDGYTIPVITSDMTISALFTSAPDPPTNVTATAGNGQATVSFVAPADDGGSTITGYTVTSAPGNITADGTSSPITVTGLTNGTSYTFTVTATNDLGTSDPSAPSNEVTPGAPSSPGKTYNITATADANSTISPSGSNTVQSGGSITFTFSAAAGYHISSVTVNGNLLTQAQIELGSFTFTNVLFNNTIEVKSSPGANYTLEITVSGGGHAEYSINGAGFVVYTNAVTIQSSDKVTVKAVADSGYRFDRWETPSTNTSSQMDLGTITGSVHLGLFFTAEGSSPSGHSNNNLLWGALIIIVLILLVLAVVWYAASKRKKND